MSILDGPLTSLAFCWAVERRDGAGLGLTSCDQPIERTGVRFEAAPGMMPAAISRKAGLEAASSEITGAVTSRALAAGDLAAGRWDGAALTLSAVDWTGGDVEQIALSSGEIGEVAVEGETFTTELRGSAMKLDAPICPVTSPTCRASLGDDKCRVDMAGRSIRATVVTSTSDTVTLDRVVEARFLLGRLRYLSGGNCGLKTVIWAVSGSAVRTRDLPPVEVKAGDVIELREGCDKLFATCSARFGNALNFRGEPHVPGNDLLTRYPGA